MGIKLWPLIGLVLAGCASAPPAERSDSRLRCISTAAVLGQRAERPNAILFEMSGPVNVRNTLMRQCPSLARLGPNAALAFDATGGGMLCPGDRVRVADARDANPGRFASAPPCVLGRFTPVPR